MIDQTEMLAELERAIENNREEYEETDDPYWLGRMAAFRIVRDWIKDEPENPLSKPQ